MIKSLMALIRKRLHPLHRLRNTILGRYLLEKLDSPVWISIPCINHSIRVSSFRNAYYIGNSDSIEPEVRAVFNLLVETYEVKSFWDVGANIGLYSYFVGGKIKGLTVTAYEPDPINLRHLHATAKRHNLTNLTIRKEAVSNLKNNQVFFTDTLSGVTGSLVDAEGIIGRKLHGVDHDLSINVGTTTLDIELSTGSPDLLKVDVEGAELLVLEGGRKLFAEKPPILIIEVKQENLTKALSFLASCYTEVFYIGNSDMSHPNLLALPPRLQVHSENFFSQCKLQEIPLHASTLPRFIV